MSLHGSVEDVAYQCGFAAAADSCDASDDIQGKFHVNPFQVVFSGTFHFDIVVPGSARKGHFDTFPAHEVIESVAVAWFQTIVGFGLG